MGSVALDVSGGLVSSFTSCKVSLHHHMMTKDRHYVFISLAYIFFSLVAAGFDREENANFFFGFNNNSTALISAFNLSIIS